MTLQINISYAYFPIMVLASWAANICKFWRHKPSIV